jgi:hypothetical protein
MHVLDSTCLHCGLVHSEGTTLKRSWYHARDLVARTQPFAGMVAVVKTSVLADPMRLAACDYFLTFCDIFMI